MYLPSSMLTPAPSIVDVAQNVANRIQQIRALNLSNQMNAMKLQYMPQLMQAEVDTEQMKPRLMSTQIAGNVSKNALMDQQYDMNEQFGGVNPKNLGTSSKEALSLEMLKNQYGEDSEIYKNALARFTATTMYGLPNVAKEQALRDRAIASGDMTKANQLGSQIAKSISDTDARKQYMAASAIVDEMNKVDMGTISQYAGVGGQIKAGAQAAKATILGEAPEDYQKYKTFKIQQVKALSDQIRKALGTSVQSGYVNDMLVPILDTLSQTWGNNPKLAMARWNWVKEWLTNYRDLYHKYAAQGIPSNEIGEYIQQDSQYFEKAAPEGSSQSVAQMVLGSNGKKYTREELLKIAGKQ